MISPLRPFARRMGLILIGASCALAAVTGSPAAPEAAGKRPVTDEYHGVKVTDDYQWLEKADDPAVKRWVASENQASRAYLDALPDRAAIAARLTDLYAKVSPNYTDLIARPAGLFALKFQPPKQQPILVRMALSAEPDSAKVVLDPNELEPRGKVAIDWYVPSPRGNLVAVSLSQNGSEDGTLYFYNTDTGEKLPDAIPRVQYPTGGGSAAWSSESAVYYTRYPHAGERPEADANFYQQVYRHELGQDPKDDAYALGKDFPRIAEIALESAPVCNAILATVANGDGGEFAHYLLPPTTYVGSPPQSIELRDGHATKSTPPNVPDNERVWRQITRFEDKVKLVRLGLQSDLYLLSVKDAPHGKVLRLSYWPRADELSKAKEVVPEDPEATIENLTPTESRLYITDLMGGPSRVRSVGVGFPGEPPVATLPLPPVSGVTEALSLGQRVHGLLLRQVSYTTPFAWLFYNGVKQRMDKTGLVGTSPVDFSDIEAVREFATSKDGTKIPLNILRRKGTKLDGTNPTLLYGYGGYSISMTPNFVFSRRLWFDRGGVYVVANLRGGGEYGEAWHAAGNLTNKQNVFDDFAASAEYLIKAGYTNPGKLAVEGGSNGGLLMGAFLTQHPDLARAVVSHVGIYDMLRVELDPNGAFNVTEFGTVKDPGQFKALYAYSPYHHVVDGTKYPAVLFMTGDNDGRVNPANSRKMTARLQAANASDHPILLRTTASAGHGMGTALTERIAQEADADAFLFDQLGMKAL